eukprot:1161284-Pelagomonas_calceolata.AAC.3
MHFEDTVPQGLGATCESREAPSNVQRERAGKHQAMCYVREEGGKQRCMGGSSSAMKMHIQKVF